MKILNELKGAYDASTWGTWFIGKSYTEDVAIREDEYNGQHPEYLDDAQCVLTVLPVTQEEPCPVAQKRAELVVLMHNALPALIECVEVLEEAATFLGITDDPQGSRQGPMADKIRAALAKLKE